MRGILQSKEGLPKCEKYLFECCFRKFTNFSLFCVLFKMNIYSWRCCCEYQVNDMEDNVGDIEGKNTEYKGSDNENSASNQLKWNKFTHSKKKIFDTERKPGITDEVL